MVDFTAWLSDPAVPRIVLLEVKVKSNGQEITRYLSTGAFISSSTDSPPDQYYEPILVGGLQFTEKLDIDGNGGLSGGDIDVANYGGERDVWLDDIWDNRDIIAWIGDPRWNKSDFQMIFNGVVATIDSKSKDTLTLQLRDKLQRLNSPVTDKKVGGTGTNKDEVVSLTFGEAHNVTPTSVTDTNAGTTGQYLTYKIHDGPVEDIIEVRDNGIPVSFTKNVSNGTFVLSNASFGTVTASVQGDKNPTYVTTIAGIVKRLATGYGTATTRYATSDIDASSFASFDIDHPQQVGVFVSGGDNLLTTCQDIAHSVDARLVTSRLGLLKLLQVRIPSVNEVAYAITQDVMTKNSLKISSRPLVKASVTLGFNKNWTVQENLATNIPDEHKKMYGEEWLSVTSTNDAAKADYKLNDAPPQTDTMLLTRVTAQAEADRRRDMWSVPRTVLQFEGTAELIGALSLGMPVSITHPRFGLANGKNGIVTTLSPNWFTGRITVEVLV
jgi:hypothetical protein